MVTSGMTFAVHHGCTSSQTRRCYQTDLIDDFGGLRMVDRSHPVMYVAVATWIPTCNIEDTETEDPENAAETDVDGSPAKLEPSKEGSTAHKNKAKLDVTPNRVLSPKQLKKKQDSDKKRMEKQKEKEERERKKNEERERAKQEKLKKIEERQKEKQLKIDQKKKEKEEKEEQKRKEKEEKEKMRKEREEREEQKRKEREQEKLKKQQEMDEKNREKQKEEEKKQKAAMAFVNFFVPIKSDVPAEKEKNVDDRQAFKTFEVKSDMKLPPLRRNYLTENELNVLDRYLEHPDETVSYLAELKQGKSIGKSSKTWPVEDTLDNDDVMYVETDSDLGETVHEDKKQKFRAKFLKFHDNRRPAYFGTWRKRSHHIKPRRPLVEDTDFFNYEEDSDDDWEDEEQGESLNGSDDEADKENEDEKDDYEIDNDFFVPHGHLSDDEVDDEEEARLAPELMKQKLKLLKDEFELDMKSKTHKLKPRYIGCVWYNKDGSNVDEAVDRYLKPLAMMAEGQIVIKARHTVLPSRKERPARTLDPQYIPIFVKVIHGNTNNQKVIIEEFLTAMANTGQAVEMPKSDLMKNLKNMATWKKCSEGSLKNKYCWLINEELKEHVFHIKPRRPLVEDTDFFNYEEDSDDDWEDEEQGESLNGSDDEADKENEDEKDDYEIDNDFFVPHGHLSDDEVDDEEEARLAPELMKQKLKLLKDEFELDMKSKTHKLKPRYIGCVWYNKDGSNVDKAVDTYLKPLAMMAEGQIMIKARRTVLPSRKERPARTLDSQYIPIFVKVIHGNTNNQKVIIEEFLTAMANTGQAVEMPKSDLMKNLKNMATWKKCSEGSLKNKYCWLINEELKEQYDPDLGETVHEDKKQKFRAKFWKFHDNRRPAYFDTWRKCSRHIKPRRPLVEDTDFFNYEEDSDDDWEDEEQGESLNGSDDEADKENEDEKDDYEIDNDFFVPHGHLSDDEIDDEEEARLALELMKQKLKNMATWKKCSEGSLKNKYCWLINEDLKEQYGVEMK
nr:unnamed protein product [Callosobruchus analis]